MIEACDRRAASRRCAGSGNSLFDPLRSSIGRRNFLSGAFAALGLSATVRAAIDGAPAFAQAAAATAKLHPIDVHHHFLPPGYLDQVASVRTGSAATTARMAKLTTSQSIEEMDKSGIATAVLSIVQPGVWLGDVAKARHLSREINEYGAKTVGDYPGRFGLFAAIPLPDTEGSFREIEYALDTLKADGIGVMTSFGDKYLGDPAFIPVWEELNRRAAVVYTHPLTPACCRAVTRDVTPNTIEWATDTTRTIASLLFSGTAARFPDIRWIFSHGGGTTPFLVSRFIRQAKEMKSGEERLPKGVLYELKKFYYDTAQANDRGALAALIELAPASQVLFGTDFPARTSSEVIEGLAAYRFNSDDLHAIERENALKLLPRLRP
jgi:predicted TIM-barrel fold metal-dependent hydrolase